MAKALRQKVRYDVFSFRVKGTFPHDNPLAVDLVRLMAAYNDMGEVIEWMSVHGSVTTKPLASKKSRIRKGIQHRVLLSLMHEAFAVFDQMQSSREFKAAVTKLGSRGKGALAQLRQSTSKDKTTMRSRLSMCRKKVTFHYDRGSFSEGLRLFPRIFLEMDRAESTIVLSRDSRAYYMLPEQVRDIITYDFKTMLDGPDMGNKLGEFIAEVVRTQGALFTFIDEMLKTYVELQGLAASFKHTVIHE